MRVGIAVVLALLVGCGKVQPTSAPPPVASAPTAAPKAAPPKTDAGPVAAQPQPSEPAGAPSGPGGSAPSSGGTVVADPSGATSMPDPVGMVTAPIEAMITQKQKIALMQAQDFLRTYEAMTGEKPKSLEEVAKVVGQPFPKPPAGFRWKYVPGSGQIDMEKE